MKLRNFLSVILVVCMLSVLLISPAMAAEAPEIFVDDKDIVYVVRDPAPLQFIKQEPEVTPYFVNDFSYRKTSVRAYNEWSGYKRASDNLKTGSSGGSISVTKSVGFATTITGDVSGLYFTGAVSGSASKSTSVGYTLNVGANQRVYIGYRVYYAVERGVREYYDITTGKVLYKNVYTKKVPQYGEYVLIRV